MKKILMAVGACLIFGYASAQLEPKTSQGTTPDTIVTTTRMGDRTNIANKDILKRNTIESGIGKPDNIKRKLPNNSTQITITTDTIAQKRK